MCAVCVYVWGVCVCDAGACILAGKVQSHPPSGVCVYVVCVCVCTCVHVLFLGGEDRESLSK